MTTREALTLAASILDCYQEHTNVACALERVLAILAQRGCEHFDAACTDGALTTLIDIVIDG